jgi:hypothetical protein
MFFVYKSYNAYKGEDQTMMKKGIVFLTIGFVLIVAG